MFRKMLVCAVLTSPFIAGPALADNYEIPARARARPIVPKGYYGADTQWRAPTHYVGNIRPAAGQHAYAGEEAAYANSPEYLEPADILATPPVTIYHQVPDTPYTQAPIRVYYTTQHEPYYNVPPYAVQAPFVGN